MRKYVFLVLAILPFMVQAQKYACVNTDYILRSVPEYNQALNKINKYVSEWKSELEAKQQEVDELREQYQQEAYLLPDNLKQRRQDEIRTKETDLRRLQQQRFSAGGDLDQKRAELMKPVQDRVYNAIERVAREKNYAFVFDKAASATVIYAPGLRCPCAPDSWRRAACHRHCSGACGRGSEPLQPQHREECGKRGETWLVVRAVDSTRRYA